MLSDALAVLPPWESCLAACDAPSPCLSPSSILQESATVPAVEAWPTHFKSKLIRPALQRSSAWVLAECPMMESSWRWGSAAASMGTTTAWRG